MIPSISGFPLIALHTPLGTWLITIPGSPIRLILLNWMPCAIYTRSGMVQSMMLISGCSVCRSIASKHRAVHGVTLSGAIDALCCLCVLFAEIPPGTMQISVVSLVGLRCPLRCISLKWLAFAHTRSSTVCAVVVTAYVPVIVMSPTYDVSVGASGMMLGVSSTLIIFAPSVVGATWILNVFVSSGCDSLYSFSSMRTVCVYVM